MYVDYQEETLNHLKNVELMILKDFIDICENNNLVYYLMYGTNIGAIRHEGFIPWDDDIDVAMPRKDYENFLKIMKNNPSSKYTIFDVNFNREYFYLFGKMSLKKTHTEEFWEKYVNFKQGIHIDIFVLDNLPNNRIKRFLFRKRCYILDMLLRASVIKFDISPLYVKLIANSMHYLLKFLNIKPQYLKKKCEKLFRKYENKNTEYVADLTCRGIPVYKKSDFFPPKKVKFESIYANIPNTDKLLKSVYGDYMKLPPKKERTNHDFSTIDFGEY